MTDEFERQYLGVEDVVHSEKVTFRGAFLLVGTLSLASAGFSVVGFVAAAGGDLQALAGGAFFALVAATLGFASVAGSVLRTIVTKSEVVCHAGVRHELRIPLAGVTQVTLTKYDPAARQRVINEGKGAFAAIHPSKPILCVEWVDAGGKDHVAYVASEAPENLAGIIRAGARRAQALGTRVRVDEVSAAMSEVEAELELEVRAKTAAPREHES
ncbi:MAG: hypothetical protein IPG17_34440 [Sandaracinaceae bacterium]|jgi:hypothetical protein|nr:hypothetical protein [Sandaracinaceae bacterium]MBP7680731.1 hypothetical protein [Deltaproteobacteria bacterium]MBK7150872.1 hypothetical protein [Sandaracinaceae bacterium]MBK7772996.1 hypothetical protein [Sandaracinaceae bacterium]MBK8407207.1 hypothetical protein [Sandaracinaceae bacterium]